jgi:hypothetical protein
VKWVIALAFGIVGTIASAWALMLLLGVLHHEISPAIPAIGYAPALVITLALGLWTGIRKGFESAIEEVLK